MQRKKGLVHILVGDGNGKTTSAVGIAARAAGRGLKVAFIQFLKSGLSSELASLRKLKIKVISKTKFCPNYQKHKLQLSKKGFTVFCRDCFLINEQDKKLCREAFKKAVKFCQAGKYDLVVLDEILWAIKKGIISEEELASLVKSKHKGCEIILTGRPKLKSLFSLADYVSEVKKIKHPFDSGVLSRAGIDY
ncbi:MAG: cob(I)yrinic acid a,c-diamide adenosyltransferase [Candidatus Micrarchaeota archaeon]|nr:cob(I)yrinic acid a,c-diamide adenosyltransferase [Candidatus Micrarchaeota archaeon]